MKSRKPTEGAQPALVDHPQQFLARQADGGFSVEAEGRPTIRAKPVDGGCRIEGHGGLEGWTLGRVGSAGFVLRSADSGREAGRTMPLVGCDGGPRFVLLEDGRLFRIRRCAPRDDGFELLGWETPGAYLTARPGPDGWTVSATAAGGGLVDIDALTLLFAAEILEAESPPRA